MDGRLIDRGNRRRISLLALVLIALGALGLLLRAGVLALLQPFQLYDIVSEEARRQPGLAIAVLILIGLLLGLLGVHWLRAQFARSGTRVGELSLTDSRRGRTTVDAEVIARALSRDIASVHGVYDARVRMVEIGAHPRFVVRVTVDGDADVGELRVALEDAFARIQQVLGTDGLETHLLVRPIAPSRARVG